MQEGYIGLLKPDGILLGGCIEDYVSGCPTLKKQLKEEFPLLKKIFNPREYFKRKDKIYHLKTGEIKHMIASYNGVELVKGQEDMLKMCLDVDTNEERWKVIGSIKEKFEEITGRRLNMDVRF